MRRLQKIALLLPIELKGAHVDRVAIAKSTHLFFIEPIELRKQMELVYNFTIYCRNIKQKTLIENRQVSILRKIAKIHSYNRNLQI